ncbi:MAG: HEAT repeat domain-containing protein [Cyanobacteria bacterium P01_E01_bin.45]
MTLDSDRIVHLEAELRSPAINIRKEALDELAEAPPEIALPILQRLAAEPDFALRRLAVMGFGNHPTQASFEALQAILEDEHDANVLAEAANSIFEFGDPAISILQDVYRRHDHWLVRQTVLALFTEGNRPSVLLSAAVEAIGNDNPMLKETGILALAQLADSDESQAAFETLERMARDNRWRNRWRAAIALKLFDTPDAKQLLAKLKQDEHFRVVAAALDSDLD